MPNLKQKLSEMQEEKAMGRREIVTLLLKHFPEHMPIWGFLERTVKDAVGKEQNHAKANSR